MISQNARTKPVQLYCSYYPVSTTNNTREGNQRSHYTLVTSDYIEKSFKVIRTMINRWSYRLIGLIWWIRWRHSFL